MHASGWPQHLIALLLLLLLLRLCCCASSAAAAARSRNRELQELFQSGLGLHHAGMLRGDRNLTERLFAEGWIKVGGPAWALLQHLRCTLCHFVVWHLNIR